MFSAHAGREGFPGLLSNPLAEASSHKAAQSCPDLSHSLAFIWDFSALAMILHAHLLTTIGTGKDFLASIVAFEMNEFANE